MRDSGYKVLKKSFQNSNFVRVLSLITNSVSYLGKKKFPVGWIEREIFMFFILSGFLSTVNFKYFFQFVLLHTDYFILKCKLWDKFLYSTIILILTIFYIWIFYRSFELFFEFMALKSAPICRRCNNFKTKTYFNLGNSHLVQRNEISHSIQLEIIKDLGKIVEIP